MDDKVNSFSYNPFIVTETQKTMIITPAPVLLRLHCNVLHGMISSAIHVVSTV